VSEIGDPILGAAVETVKAGNGAIAGSDPAGHPSKKPDAIVTTALAL
jgi:hypothetical protein